MRVLGGGCEKVKRGKKGGGKGGGITNTFSIKNLCKITTQMA